MRHVTTPRILVLEKAAHHKACAWIAHVVLPAVHWVAKAIEFALLKAHGGIEVVDVLLAITLLMVSLPVLAKWIFRRHAVKQTQLAGSWGS